MIPKRIFFYWGNPVMSWMRYMTLWSFRKFNPDWEMILFYSSDNLTNKTWTEYNTQDFHSFQGRDYSDRLGELNIKLLYYEPPEKMGSSHASNFLKWSKLHEEGGIYSDMDILYFRGMDGLYDQMKDNDVAICQTEYISIGLLAGSPGNEFYRDIYNHALDNIKLDAYQSAGVMSVYSLYNDNNYIVDLNVLKKAQKKYPHLNFFNIPMDTIYHFPWNQVDHCIRYAFEIRDYPKEAIGYHWYAGSPLIQHYNNVLNEDNYRSHKITFTELAGEIL